MNLYEAHGLRVRRVTVDGKTTPSTSHVPPPNRLLTFDLVCPATDVLEDMAPWGEEPLDALMEKLPHLDRFYTSGRWHLSRLFNFVRGRR